MRDALLAGRDVGQIHGALAALRSELNCSKGPACANLDYWMGVSSELMGDERAAIESYVSAWSEAPDGLEAVWIRLKLEPLP